MYGAIVVGTDGSARAGRAVTEAAELAGATGAELHVVSAFSAHPDPSVAEAAREAPEEVRWRVTAVAAAEQHAADAAAAAEAAGAGRVRTHVEAGDPAEVLIDVAERHRAEVIVVGNRGMSSASRFVLGNVPNKISHHAPCDVLIVHTGGTRGGR